MTELLGHFHPIIVHLPIGVILVGILLQWLSTRQEYSSLKPAIPLVLLLGTVCGIISCITGYMLSINDDYDAKMINWHMWMAIATVIVSFVLYLKEKNWKIQIPHYVLSVGLLILIMATGHFGGSLTHGSDYLTKPLLKVISDDSTANTAIKPLINVQEALVYGEVVQPILKAQCYSCHNANKQKGGLRMDDINFLMKGGKHGHLIDLEKADSSELIRRMLLPKDDEHHMPPKEKPQPSENQIALLHWWISNKADFKKKVKDLRQPDRIKPVLLALQQPAVKKQKIDIPTTPVDKADEKIIAQLTNTGFVVLPLAQNTNYLMANFIGTTSVGKNEFELINKLSRQLLFLKITGTTIKEEAIPFFSNLSNLRRLNLSNTNITDKALQYLSSLQNLQQLNLVGTRVTAKGVVQLQKLKSLQTLYLYQTNIASAVFKELKAAFPKTQIDTGHYVVPLLTTDTTLVKQIKTK